MKFEKPRKPKLSLEQAKALAEDHIVKLDLRGWRCEIFSGGHDDLEPDHWSFGVDYFSPEGSLVDGPGVFFVHGRTGEVITFDEYFEAHMKGLSWPAKDP